jgi:hypothetical protein
MHWQEEAGVDSFVINIRVMAEVGDREEGGRLKAEGRWH